MRGNEESKYIASDRGLRVMIVESLSPILQNTAKAM